MPEYVYQSTIRFLKKELTVQQLEKIYEDYSKINREERLEYALPLIEMFTPILEMFKNSHSKFYYFFLSFLIQVTERTELLNGFIQAAMAEENLSKEQKVVLYSYITQVSFFSVVRGNEETSGLVDGLYKKIYTEFSGEIEEEFSFIPRKERNQELVFVLISQVLGLGHGPTKTLLDRCEIIKRELKKEVFIINTAETVTDLHGLPLFHISVGNYREQYSNLDNISYHGLEFPFFQCPKEMPSVPIIYEIMKMVADEKPLCIVSIGGNSITSDLCSRIVPVISIATVFSSRIQTFGQFQVLGRKITEKDYAWAARRGFPKEHFIESRFTFALKEQEHHYTRKELRLPEEGFIVALVGGRLEIEIDEACLSVLRKLMEQDIYIAIIGGGKRFDELRKEDGLFHQYLINMGFQEDVLAVLECVDIYMNPKRIGGGTAIIEALYQGIPAVTLDYGDSAKSAGEDFFVEDYDAMYEQILRYKNDREFYDVMSKKAKERADFMMDSKTEFVRIMQEAMAREAFDMPPVTEI